MGRLVGKSVIITGGAGGIGIAAGRRFVEEGAQVLLVDLHEAPLVEAVASIGSGAVSYVVADVTQPGDVQRYVQAAVERHGGVDVFINNAGIEGQVSPIVDYDVDDFDRVMAVNVRGAWLGLKYVMPEMERRGGGSIIITSSIAGIEGNRGMSAYTTSKHAVIGLMRTASQEGADSGIRVNCVNPAPIETRMMRSLEEKSSPGAAEESRTRIASALPMQRYGTPEEVANLMLFLASDESSYCTGGVYMVDGGVSAAPGRNFQR